MWRRVRVEGSCLQPGMTRPRAAELVPSSPSSRGGEPGCSFPGRQVPERLGEHPLPLRSGQCLGWAWRGESAESLGTEVNPAAGLGLGGQASCKTLRLAVKPISRLLEILSRKTALNLSVPVPTHTQM